MTQDAAEAERLWSLLRDLDSKLDDLGRRHDERDVRDDRRDERRPVAADGLLVHGRSTTTPMMDTRERMHYSTSSELLNVENSSLGIGATEARDTLETLKCRAAVEPGIGYLKREHRMDRKRLKATLGDRIKCHSECCWNKFQHAPQMGSCLFTAQYFVLIFSQRAVIAEALFVK